jgi:hypothetical protein
VDAPPPRFQGKAWRAGTPFHDAYGHRKAIPIPQEWAQGLNLVDVVYANRPKVVAKYHALYTLPDSPPVDPTKLQHSRMELLSEMAMSLGYKGLQQTDIDKFYLPQGHTDQAGRQLEIQTELLRVLKASKNMAEGKPQIPKT